MAALELPAEIGRYRVLASLGRGGMGAVYRARVAGSDREVALKLLLDEALTAGRRLRFQRETSALAGLRHPHVIRIHDAGEHQGRPYLVMELLGAGSLRERLNAEGPLEARAAAILAEPLARALAAVHRQGLLHRDVKPENVLLREDGQPLLADFGLVRRQESRSLTRTGQVLGTEAYMAPEQAQGREDLDGRADIYALGATLYDLLTGQPPFLPPNLLAKVVHQSPRPPSDLRPGLDPELDCVVLSCLEKDPRDRYPNAEALAADLGRYLRGEPVTVLPLHPLRRTWRSLRRRGFVAPLLVSGLALGVGLGSWRIPRERPQRVPVAPRSASSRADPRPSTLCGVAQSALTHARDLAARGELDTALAQYAFVQRRLLDLPPDARAELEAELPAEVAEVHCRRAEHRLRTQAAGAEGDARAALRLRPSARAHHLLGLAVQDPGEAIAAIGSSLRLRDNTRARLDRGDRHRRRGGAGDLDQAIRDYRVAHREDPGALPTLEPGSAAERLYQALLLRAERRLGPRPAGAERELAEAEADLDEALEINPLSQRGYLKRATARLDQGHHEGFREDVTAAEEIDPSQHAVHIRRALLREWAGEPEAAQEDFRRAVREKLSSAHYGLSRPPQAREAYREIARREVERALPEFVRQVAAGDPVPRLLEALWVVLPDDPRLLALRAELCARAGDLVAAQEAYTQALLGRVGGGGEPAPLHAQAWLARALAGAQLERFDRALADLQQAEVRGLDPRAWHELRARLWEWLWKRSAALRERGLWHAAASTLTELPGGAPADPAACLELARLWGFCGEWERVLELGAEPGLRDSGDGWFLRALAHRALGQFAPAALLFERVVELDPSAEWPNLDASVAWDDAGQPERARQALARIPPDATYGLGPNWIRRLIIRAALHDGAGAEADGRFFLEEIIPREAIGVRAELRAKAVNNRGITRRLTGHFAEALADHERGMAVLPDHGGIPINRLHARVLTAAPDELAQVRREFDEFVGGEDMPARLRAIRALLRLRLGDAPGACADYALLREKVSTPQDHDLRLLHVDALLMAGNLRDAQREARWAVQAVPRDPAAHLRLGRVLLSRGSQEAGLASLGRARELAPCLLRLWVDRFFPWHPRVDDVRLKAELAAARAGRWRIAHRHPGLPRASDG